MVEKAKPWIILISGPNGAGKTTFYKRILSQNPFLAGALFANFDVEYAEIVNKEENKNQCEFLEKEISRRSEEVRKNLTVKFNKVMTSVSGDLQERIDKKDDINKDYWAEQYSVFVHLPTDYENVADGLVSCNDLMHRIGGNVHERINKKEKKQNWYKLYKRCYNTVEVQDALMVEPVKTQLDLLVLRMQRKASEIVLSKINNAFENNKNIIFETTGSGHMAVKLSMRAKKIYKYNVFSFHPYVLRPELSIARVHKRVANGGHDVPVEVILQRYDNSLKTLPDVLNLVDVGIVMDNSGKKPYIPVFAKVKNSFISFGTCPEYLQTACQAIKEKNQNKTINEVLHLQQDMDMKQMTEEQRESFAHIVITNLLGQIR